MLKKYLFQKSCIVITLLLMCSVSFHCSKSPVNISEDGTGTIIGNGIISATLVTENGDPLQTASVRIRKCDYITDHTGKRKGTTKIDTVTDMNGMFSVVLPDTGFYSIEVVKGDTLGKLLSCSLTTKMPYRVFDTINALPYGKINGQLHGSNNFSNYAIKVYGLERNVLVGNDGTYSLILPDGRYRILVQNRENNEKTYEQDNVEVTSNKTVLQNLILPEQYSPCNDYSCDSLIIVKLLTTNKLLNLDINEITETANGRITGIEISDVVLDSIIDEIGQLDQIKTLEFEECQITYISPNIGKLTNISELTFKHCNLVSLPLEICELLNIKECDISRNKLCNVSSELRTWADKVDPDWSSTQKCK